MMALTPIRLFLYLCISISLLRPYTLFSRSPLVNKTLFENACELEWVVLYFKETHSSLVHVLLNPCLLTVSLSPSLYFSLTHTLSFSLIRPYTLCFTLLFTHSFHLSISHSLSLSLSLILTGHLHSSVRLVPWSYCTGRVRLIFSDLHGLTQSTKLRKCPTESNPKLSQSHKNSIQTAE